MAKSKPMSKSMPKGKDMPMKNMPCDMPKNMPMKGSKKKGK